MAITCQALTENRSSSGISIGFLIFLCHNREKGDKDNSNQHSKTSSTLTYHQKLDFQAHEIRDVSVKINQMHHCSVKCLCGVLHKQHWIPGTA